jgi:transposase
MQIKTGAWRRDLAGLQQRRLHAARMFACGATQAEVARTFGVSRQAASVWYRQWHHGGESALRGAGRTGRPPRLSRAELDAVDQALRLGPQAFGFDTQLWTLDRIAAVIQQLTGVRFHPGHVWRLLRRLDWSVQRPTRRALERDEAEIARWRTEEWPRIKGGRWRAVRGSASWTSPASRCGHRCGAPGRPAGRPPSCTTTATGSGRPWPGSAATPLAGRGRGCASTPSPPATTPTP